MQSWINLNAKKLGSNNERTAPKVAPDEIPSIPGSAKEFLKKPWNTHPLPARTNPESITSNERGNLIWVKIFFCINNLTSDGWEFFKPIICKKFSNDIF